ncbi:MAG: diphosphomevalonate decarboxylase [Deltaproteobacteria bacterium]|nr:MAG: diphosphomevalonate decarboxylase [Deltaproteobacteria bacterium]
MSRATATAHPNIALIKYWGKRDLGLNLPAVGSLSLTLDRFHTTTQVTWGAPRDEVHLNGSPAASSFARKVLAHLDRIDPHRPPCAVDTHNSFPTAAGLASSASGFAALTLAGIVAAGLLYDPIRASILARQGSGSACRSLWGGFVRWHRGTRADGQDSHGEPVAGPDHWDVRMVVALVTSAQKAVGSTEGMIRTRRSSPYYPTWVETSEADLSEGLAAVQARDLERLGTAMERSTYKMHATMHTAEPPILYWQPATVAVLHTVAALRQRGVGAWCTMDAGPNVKILCEAADAHAVARAVGEQVQQVEILGPGGDPTVEIE